MGRPDQPEVVISDAVTAALGERPPPVGAWAQAFPFATTLEDGTPHVILLSPRELAFDPGAGVLRVVLTGRRTTANLERTRQATLFVLTATAANSLAPELVRSKVVASVVGAEHVVRNARAGDIGIPLSPTHHQIIADLPTVESWERSARVLEVMAGSSAQG